MLDGIKNALELKGGINGLKLILGAALIALAHQIAMVHDLMPLYPDAHGLDVVLNFLNQAVVVIQKILSVLGNGFLGLGFLDKIRKLFTADR